MLILSLIIRPAINTSTGKVGDNLAIVVCLLVVLTGLIGSRIARRIDEPLAQQALDRREAREAKIRADKVQAEQARAEKARADKTRAAKTRAAKARD